MTVMVDDVVRRLREEERRIHGGCGSSSSTNLGGLVYVPPVPPPNSLLLMRQFGTRGDNLGKIPIIHPDPHFTMCRSIQNHDHNDSIVDDDGDDDDDDGGGDDDDDDDDDGGGGDGHGNDENHNRHAFSHVPHVNMNNALGGHTLFLDMTNNTTRDHRPNSVTGSLWERRSIPKLADIEVQWSIRGHYPR